MGKLYIFSGAGLSADSGIATFRGKGGRWNDVDVDKVANFNTWRENKKEVFDFYNERRVEMWSVKPNAAHQTIAELEKLLGSDRVVNMTQNIDHLLEDAGCSDVIHLHGDINTMQCLNCGHKWDIGFTKFLLGDPCPECYSFDDVKPGVVMFYESAPRYVDLYTKFSQISPEDVILVIGTSGNVVPPQYIVPGGYEKTQAPHKFPFCILVNLDLGMFELQSFDLWFKSNAAECLPEIKQLILDKLQ